ncbi:MAG: lysophospholipid acyltransferase family protein [Actinomycetota bacterium]
METVLRPPLQLWFNWRLEGLDRIPSEGPLIVAGNHLSYLDPLAHGYFVDKAGRHPRFLAKQELFDKPIVGTALRGAGQIPVRRGAGDASPLEDTQRALEEGEVVVIYPEGTTTTTNADFSPGPGKTGAVRLSLATGVPILPVATWGGQYVWRKDGRQSLAFGRPIWLRAGEPLDLRSRVGADADPASVRALTDEVMDELSTLVADLRERYPARWARVGGSGEEAEPRGGSTG